MAEELGRVERGEPIRARPIGALGKLERWCRRKPALASALGVVGFLLLIMAIGSPIAILRIQAARELSDGANRGLLGLIASKTSRSYLKASLHHIRIEDLR